MSSEFSYPKWCIVNGVRILLCLLTNLDIRKIIYVVQISFRMVKSGSDIFVIDLYIENFVISLMDMNIQNAKIFKLLKTKWTFYMSVLGGGESANNCLGYVQHYFILYLCYLLQHFFFHLIFFFYIS